MTDHLAGRQASRVQAIDVVRGFVMVIMTLDHSSTTFNAGRIMYDSALVSHPGLALDPAQFVVRWVTHLCAPTFVFLAGASLALSVTRRLRDGVPGWSIDRDILIRGALLIALDVAWMGWVWRLGLPIQLGVLYAIGASMIGMIVLRRLPAAGVGALGVAVMVGGEALAALLDPGTPLAIATMGPGQVGSVQVLYSFLPWTGFLMVGWAAGKRLASGPAMRARDWLARSGIAAVVFAVVRGANGYGNAHMPRSSGSWIEWLHVSKYPPSLAYAGLELAIAFALLAAAWWWTRAAPSGGDARRQPGAKALWRPLAVLGQTALFYYLLHVHLFKAAAVVLGLYKTQGLVTTFIAWAAMLVALYPVSRWYLGVKRRHPDSVLRFL